MIRACLCFDDPNTFLLAQRSQYPPDIFFDLPVYYHPTVFRGKHYMIPASPCGVLQTLYIFFSQVRRPPGSLPVAVGRLQLYSTRRFFHYIILLHSPAEPGLFFAKANKTTALLKSNAALCDAYTIFVLRRRLSCAGPFHLPCLGLFSLTAAPLRSLRLLLEAGLRPVFTRN